MICFIPTGFYHLVKIQILPNKYNGNSSPYLWFSCSHCAISTTDNISASTWDKLSHPANTAHKETGINEEQDKGGISASILPVNDETQLK